MLEEYYPEELGEEEIIDDATGVEEPAVVEGEASEPQPEAGDDLFEGKFNPNELPPELLPVYKGMQSAYTRKTQELAQRMREIEDHREKIEFIKQIETLQEENPKLAAEVLMLMAKQYDPSIATNQKDEGSTRGQEIDWELESPGVRYLAQILGNLLPQISNVVTKAESFSSYLENIQREKELSELEKEIGAFDREKVVAAARNYPPGTPLKAIALATLYPELKDRIVKEAYANIGKKSELAIKQSGAQTQPVTNKPISFAEAWRLAKQGIKLE